jgi:hypothetical protein
VGSFDKHQREWWISRGSPMLLAPLGGDLTGRAKHFLTPCHWPADYKTSTTDSPNRLGAMLDRLVVGRSILEHAVITPNCPVNAQQIAEDLIYPSTFDRARPSEYYLVAWRPSFFTQ